MDFHQLAQLPMGLIAMLAGVILLYAAAQSLSGTVSQALVDSPGWRAFWHGGPIAAAALVATCLGHGEMAIGVLTGSSVAALSLVPGVCKVVATVPQQRRESGSLNKLFLAPALLLWLIGKRTEISWLTAGFLALQGILILWIGRECRTYRRLSFWTGAVFLLATGVAAAAAVLAFRGAVLVRADLPTLTSGIFAGGIIAPILILPLLGECVRLTEENRADEASSMRAILAIINLTAVLPLCVTVSYLGGHFLPGIVGAPLAFPLANWRVDCVVLVILAAWMFSGIVLPRWASRMEGLLLIVLYGTYLISLARVDLAL